MTATTTKALRRGPGPAAPPPAADGPGVAALTKCLQCVRKYLSAGVEIGTGMCRLLVKEIDAALSSSPEAELAAAVGGASLTPAGTATVRFVLDYRRRNYGVSPRLADVAAALGISKSAAFDRLDYLAAKGVVSRQKCKSRNIRLVHLDGRA